MVEGVEGEGTAARALSSSQREWLRVREHLRTHRYELSAVAAGAYPGTPKVSGTSLLAAESWLPERPLPLESIELRWTPSSPLSPSSLAPSSLSPVTATPAGGAVLPERPDGSRYQSYSAAMRDLAAPQVFRNRSTYRLYGADLAGTVPAMAFGPGSYFDGVDVGEACAHELVAARLGLIDGTPLRDAVGDPCDPARRPTNMAISVLTLRVDRHSGAASFPLHWRDPAKVGHAGGLHMVVPVGVFQASGDAPCHQGPDFSLWRSIVREFAEELLGESEDHDENVPIDYDAWPLAARLARGRRDGEIRASCLGMGVDPLTFATDLLAVVAIDAKLYDDLFGTLVATNDEGRLVTSGSGAGPEVTRFEFTGDAIERLLGGLPFQAAGAAQLRRAWSLRSALLG